LVPAQSAFNQRSLRLCPDKCRELGSRGDTPTLEATVHVLVHYGSPAVPSGAAV
jgi:hypothetical protein